MTKNIFVTQAIEQYRLSGSTSTSDFENRVGYIPVERLSETAFIFVDMFRATTTLGASIAAGCPAIFLDVKPTDGRHTLTPPVLLHQEWLFGGEENGLPIKGGVVNNSPLSIDSEVLRGRNLKFYSTNGARALRAILQARPGAVFLANAPNADATADHCARANYAAYCIVNAGFYGSPALEDIWCGGRIARRLCDRLGLADDLIDDGARLMMNNFAAYRDNLALLTRHLLDAQVAHLLANIGRIEDVRASIDGTGMDPVLWGQMRRSVIQLRDVDGVPLLMLVEAGADPNHPASEAPNQTLRGIRGYAELRDLDRRAPCAAPTGAR